MDDTQTSHGESKGKGTKLWTYVSLGLIVGTLFLLRRRNIKKQMETADEERVTAPDINLSEIKVQLDRIEKALQKTALDGIRLWFAAIGIGLIIATPTIIATNVGLALLMFILGSGLIALAAIFRRK